LIHSELVEGERGAATICFLFLCAILFFPLVILQLGRGFELFCTLLGLVLCKIGIVAIIRYFHYEVTSMGMGSYFLQIGHGLLLDFLFWRLGLYPLVSNALIALFSFFGLGQRSIASIFTIGTRSPQELLFSERSIWVEAEPHIISPIGDFYFLFRPCSEYFMWKSYNSISISHHYYHGYSLCNLALFLAMAPLYLRIHLTRACGSNISKNEYFRICRRQKQSPSV